MLTSPVSIKSKAVIYFSLNEFITFFELTKVGTDILEARSVVKVKRRVLI